jgi:hypothetical protein
MNVQKIVNALSRARIRADYYQTGEGELFKAAVNAIFEQQSEIIHLRIQLEQARRAPEAEA